MITESSNATTDHSAFVARRPRIKIKVSTVHFLFTLAFLLSMLFPYRLWLPAGPIRTFTLLDIVIIAYGVVLLLRAAMRNELYVGSTLLWFLLATPLLLAVLSLAWTQNTVATIKFIVYQGIALLGYVVVVNLLRHRDPHTILKLAGTFAVGSILLAMLYWSRIPIVWSMFNFALGSELDPESYEYAAAFARLDSPFWGRSNDFGTVLAVFALFFLGVALATGYKKWLFFFFATSLGVVLTLSRGVILSVTVAILPALFIQKLTRRKLQQLVILLLIVFITLVVLFFFIQAISNTGIDILDSRLNNASNLLSRFEKYEYGLQLIAERPLLGAGAGRYMAAADTDALDSALHNTFLEYMASFGIPLGMLASASLLAIPFYFWFAVRKTPTRSIGRYIALAVTAYILVASNQTSNEAVMPRLGFFLFLGFALAYLKSFAQSERTAAASSNKYAVRGAPVDSSP